MNDIQIFNFEEKEIRTVIKNGEVWFVGIDVCRVLGYKRPNDAINQHCDDTVKHRIVDSLGRKQDINIVSESDLYNLIYKSKMPNAEKFKSYLINELLPKIKQNINKNVSNVVQNSENKDISVFNFEKFEVRTIVKDGEIWFVGVDVCRVLGYGNPHEAIRGYCEDREKFSVLSKGGSQDTYIIPESDLYNLIFHSKMPKAKEFRKWVTKEVLPSIRKTGSYSFNQKLPQTYLEALKELVKTEEERLKLEAENKEMKPKADMYQKVIESNNTISFREFSQIFKKEFGIGRNTLMKLLRSFQILDDNNLPYQKYSKYFSVYERPYEVNGENHVGLTTEINVSTQDLLYKLIKNKLEDGEDSDE